MSARSPSHAKSPLAQSWLILAFGALCAVACGGGEHTDVPPSDNADADASVSSGVNVCPHFLDSLALPQRISSGQSAAIGVHATDPDGADSGLVYHWSATSGRFSPNDKAVTFFTCSKAGTTLLTVTATDPPGCAASLTLTVECVSS
jgi:hypothetical protein